VDTNKPLIGDTIEGNGISGRWTKGSPTLSVNVSDKGFGLASIEVTTSDGELIGGSDKSTYQKTYSADSHTKSTKFSFQAAKNGTYKIKATDLAGNVSETKTVKVENIDRNLPTATVGEVTKSAVETRIPITFKDRESGIDSNSAYYTTLGIKDVVSDHMTYTHPMKDNAVTLSPDFQGKVCITVKDKAGNSLKEPSCWIVSDDKEVPVVDISSDETTKQWTKDKRMITISAKDQMSKDTGIRYMEVTSEDGKIDASNEHHLTKDYGAKGKAAESYTFAVSANGTYQITVCDYAENCANSRIAITKIDLSAPVITDIKVTTEHQFGLFITNVHKISFVAHDEPVTANSGLKEIRYQLVGDKETYEDDKTSSKWQSIAYDKEITTEEDFIGTVYAYAIDQVGNTSKIHKKRIDRISEDQNAELSDENKTVTILGISDPDVKLVTENTDLEEVEKLLGKDFLDSYDLQDVYNFSLVKNGNPYTLEDSVKIRLNVEKELLENESLELISVNEDGKTEKIDASIQDNYMEFESDALSKLYATVTKKQELRQDASVGTVQVSGVMTGESHSVNGFMTLVISAGMIIAMIVWYKQKQSNE